MWSRRKPEAGLMEAAKQDINLRAIMNASVALANSLSELLGSFSNVDALYKRKRGKRDERTVFGCVRFGGGSSFYV
jgi:hypothetical protein